MSDITVDGHLKLGERRLGMIEYRKKDLAIEASEARSAGEGNGLFIGERRAAILKSEPNRFDIDLAAFGHLLVGAAIRGLDRETCAQ